MSQVITREITGWVN